MEIRNVKKLLTVKLSDKIFNHFKIYTIVITEIGYLFFN